MNKLLSLSGKIYSSANSNGGGEYKIEHNDYVSIEDVIKLETNISDVIKEWKSSKEIICDPIISIRHHRVIPKSKRVQKLFYDKDKPMNSAVVGAYYDERTACKKHVIVYRFGLEILKLGLERLDKVAIVLSEYFSGKIDKEQMRILFSPKKKLNEHEISLRNMMINWIERGCLSKTVFGQLIQDISTIENIFVNSEMISMPKSGFISFYDTGLNEYDLLEILGLPTSIGKMGNEIDGYAYLLTPAQLADISYRFPYLVSMSSQTDVSSIPPVTFEKIYADNNICPPPGNEPIVGVIDSSFDMSANFASWVDYRYDKDYFSDSLHGTAITSLIVDGPKYNPDLEDSCGRFRVRHFAVLDSDNRVSQLELYKRLDHIVRTNSDIKVWNLSIGTDQPIEKNSISPIASLLDRLQAELDVVFIVAGTNNTVEDSSFPMIGAPADSINSIVVNSVDKDGSIPAYARRGPVLSFYQRPNICAIGGSSNKPLKVYSRNGISNVHGTSFAACWVTRKIAFLIHRLHLTREVAKALIIDAAYGWNIASIDPFKMGCGILPVNILDIITTPNDEFKIVIKDVSSQYMTYGYNIPIPLFNGKFPFLAKATLCYFSNCSRKQGVDYTLTELDLHFGRMNGTSGVKTINHNRQGDAGTIELYEEDMKSLFGKWDTVKHITEGEKTHSKGKKAYGDSIGGDSFGGWGFYVNKKKRFGEEDSEDSGTISFGLVMTFKSIDKRNRINDFMRYARSQNWIVSEIDVEVMNEIYEEGQEEVKFDD